jgi:hypothetical protein
MFNKKIAKIILRTLFIIVISAVIFGLKSNKVAAAVNQNPTGIPASIVTLAKSQCAATNDVVAEVSWLSFAGDSTDIATTLTVISGEQTDLWWNVASYYCNVTNSADSNYYDTDGGVNIAIYTDYRVNDIEPSDLGISRGTLGSTLLLNPDILTFNDQWYTNHLAFSIDPTESLFGQNIEFSWQAINQFNVTGVNEFQCVTTGGQVQNNRGSYTNFDGPPQCDPQSWGFNLTVIVDVTITGYVYDYSPKGGLAARNGVTVTINDHTQTEGTLQPQDTTGDISGGKQNQPGQYTIYIQKNDDFGVNLGAQTGFYVYPNDGDGNPYTGDCPYEPTNPPYCPAYQSYVDQEENMGSTQTGTTSSGEAIYNLGQDSGYDFVFPTSEIINNEVDTSGNSLGSGFTPVAEIIDPLETASTNPYDFTSNLYPLTGGIQNKYILENIDPSYTYNGNTYTLQGYTWCNTTSCDPGGVHGDNWHSYPPTSNASVTLTIPISDDSLSLNWVYEEVTTCTNFDITGYTTMNGQTAPSDGNPITVTVGTQLKFDNYLDNIGTSASCAINYQVYLNAEEIKDSSVNSLNPTQPADVYSNTVDTTGDPAGTEYCESIFWSPVNAGGGQDSGTMICAILSSGTDFNITGYTTMNGQTAPSDGSPILVTAGTSLKFVNYLTNTGPDKSSLINYQVYLNASEIDSDTVTLNATQSSPVYTNTKDTTGNSAGTEYCESIFWYPVNAAGGQNSGTIICAEIESTSTSNNFNITGFTTVSSAVVQAGTPITFDNYLVNLGSEKSPLITYSVYLGTVMYDTSSTKISPPSADNVYSNIINTTGDPNDTKYCEYISWEPVSDTDNGSSHGATVCALVEATTSSNFNITGHTTVSSPTVTAGGSVVFRNYLSNTGANRSPVISYSVYRNTALIDSSKANGLDPGGPYNVFSETFNVPLGTPAGTSYCEFISWSPVTPTNTGPASGAKACTTVKAPPLNCPTFPNFATVPITLPDNALGLAASAPTTDTNTPGARQVEIDPEYTFEITNLNDVSAVTEGGQPILPYITPAVGVKDPDSTSVTMDYTPYVETYPYDINQPSVTYENFYYQTVWTTGSTPIFYSCPNPADTVNGQHDCTHTATSSTLALYDAADHMWYCTAGTLVGHTCVVTTTVNDGPATPWYAWSPGPTTEQAISSTSGQVANTSYPGEAAVPAATQMPACLNRTFSLNDAGEPVNSATIDDPEDPTLLTVTGNVQADFDVVDPTQGIGFRQPTQVDGIDTVIVVEVWHQNSDGSIVEQNYYQDVSSPNLYPNYVGTSTDYQSTPDYTMSWSMPVSFDPPLQYGDEICIDLTTNPSVGQISPSTNWAPQDVTLGLSNQQDADDPWPTSPQSVCTPFLAAAPYLKVYDGDVSAGTASDINKQQCYDSDAGIDTFNQGTSPYAGAGTQLAAFAVNVINGFASAQNDSGSGTSPPIGLTFSNTLGGTYGGDFGPSPSDCSTDYYNQGIASASTQYTDAGDILTSSFFANNPTGIYAFKVNGGIINATNIPVGYNITLYSSGSITIAGNITYGGVSTTLSQMPNLEIVTYQQPINIDHNVTQLTGIYVAEGAGGIINDCADVPSTNNWYPSTDGSPSCGQQLIVEGSFTANALYLSRTTNSIHFATPTEVSCASGVSPCDMAAEEFDYSPVNWLTYPSQNTTPVVQAITGLPPIL